MPLIFAAISVDGDNRREEEIIEARRVAKRLVPRRAIADAEDHGVILFIINDGIPDCAATAIGFPSASLAP